MKITKYFLKEVLNNVVSEYSQRIVKLPYTIELKFQDKEDFLNSAKNDYLIQQQINLGIYKSFEEEYPNFLVVYNSDKNEIRSVLGIPFYITVCFELAKKRLKPFTKEDVENYLSYNFAHEITHIAENKIKIEKSELWDEAIKETEGRTELASEILAENIGRTFGDERKYKNVESKLWGIIYNRINRMSQQRKLL